MLVTVASGVRMNRDRGCVSPPGALIMAERHCSDAPRRHVLT